MKKINLLILTLVLVLSLSLTAVANYQEAPMLKDKVDAGELPAVEERLPDNPMEINPWHETGEYGGTWDRFTLDENYSGFRMNMYGGSLLRYADDARISEDTLKIVPNLVEDWESNEEKTIWTLHFREGLKWSDGHPLTVDDMIYWWERMALNDEHSEVVPDWAIAAGEVMQIERIDDYTMKLKFAETSPLLEDRLAMWSNIGVAAYVLTPEHYMKQFDPKYSSEYDDFQTFEEKQEWWINVDHPVLTAWNPVKYEAGKSVVLERNPYYYAVDTEGNQLPYIDKVNIRYLVDKEVMKLKIMNGEADMQFKPNVASVRDLGILKKKSVENKYRVITWDEGSGSGPVYTFNRNHKDPNKNELFKKHKFLMAMSHAINRDRINKMIFYNTGEPTTGTFSPKAIEYNRTEEGQEIYKKWRDLAVEYKPEKSKELLDEIGIVDQDGDGWREFENGDDLKLIISANAGADDFYVDTDQIVKSGWENIGIQVEINPAEGSALLTDYNNAEFDIRSTFKIGDGPNHLVFPNWLVPIESQLWASLYANWYSVKGTEAEGTELDKAPRDRTPPRKQPPVDGPVHKLQELYDQAKVEPDWEERDRLVREMIQIHIDNGPFMIGTINQTPYIGVVNDYFKNVPFQEELATGGMAEPWTVVYPGIVNPSQYYMDK